MTKRRYLCRAQAPQGFRRAIRGIPSTNHAPVAQWRERRPPEPEAQVRFLPGAHAGTIPLCAPLWKSATN